MEATTETAPSGNPATAALAPVLSQDDAPIGERPPDGGYLDLTLDDELVAAAAAAAESVAAAEHVRPTPTPTPMHAIPDLPRAPPPPRPFLPQLALLAGVALLVGVVAIAAARPPAPAASPMTVALAPPLVAAAPPAAYARIAPEQAELVPTPAPYRRAAVKRARPVRFVPAPVEIGAPATLELRERPAVSPVPVSAPVLERGDDQSIKDPPLTGT